MNREVDQPVNDEDLPREQCIIPQAIQSTYSCGGSEHAAYGTECRALPIPPGRLLRQRHLRFGLEGIVFEDLTRKGHK